MVIFCSGYSINFIIYIFYTLFGSYPKKITNSNILINRGFKRTDTNNIILLSFSIYIYRYYNSELDFGYSVARGEDVAGKCQVSPFRDSNRRARRSWGELRCCWGRNPISPKRLILRNVIYIYLYVYTCVYRGATGSFCP